MSSVDLAGLSGVFSSLQRLSNIDRHLWSVNLASCTPHITLARKILIYNRVFGCVQSSTRVHGMVVPCEMCHCQRGCQVNLDNSQAGTSHPQAAWRASPLGALFLVERRGSGSPDVLCSSSKTCEDDGMSDKLTYLSVASTGLGCD